MTDLYYKLFCFIYDRTKRFLGKRKSPIFRMYSCKTPSKDLFPIENICPLYKNMDAPDSFIKGNKATYKWGKSDDKCIDAWNHFVESSAIPFGYKNEGIHYAGYIKEYSQWCLPSWIWTNGALVRYFVGVQRIKDAELLANIIIQKQLPEGGWVVRHDYSQDGELQVVAPNDSAYLANHALIPLYKVTGKRVYLDAAKKCAKWIMESARKDGMVYIGYYKNKGEWNKKNNIVDVGFTVSLISELYKITDEKKYSSFIEKFIRVYINQFYIPSKKCFTASTINDKASGGLFARGQSWALEGLIPSYEILNESYIKKVIEEVIDSLLKEQNKNGSWAFVLDRPYLGEDCKGTPVIAKSLMQWYDVTNDEKLKKAALKAFEWCNKHTCMNEDNEAYGGIFSFNSEGAVVHHHNTSCAFVYSSVYALELAQLLNK